MTGHFMSDVCFGTLITYLIYSLISIAFLRIVSGRTDNIYIKGKTAARGK